MTTWTLLLIALGLSADAFAVALGKGLSLRRLRLGQAWAIALTFGGFQALMPVIGWLLGATLADRITAVDHWIAFGLLAAIGAKMLWEALHGDDDVEPASGLEVRELLVLGVATSIDALAVGVSLAFLEADLGIAALTIGVVTALVSFAGVVIGHRVGLRLRRPAEIAGGVVLIAIGVKILVEHLG